MRPVVPERLPRSERAVTQPGFDHPAVDESIPGPMPEFDAQTAPPPAEPATPVLPASVPPPGPMRVGAPIAAPIERRGERPRPDVPPHLRPGDGDEAGVDRAATAPQLRRFIKSRAYVPMHELRRRFAINGGDDDVTVVEVDRQRVYVGLPEREGRLLGDLLRGGDIGYELSLDPISPIVVGVYPMRPVTRA
jgi:hypothetical protein